MVRLTMVLAALGVVLTGSCSLFFPSTSYRQKITVEVETPLGTRTGSAVVETTMSDGKRWGDASGTSWKLRGEAVAVDLPGGRTLFALLRGSRGDVSDPAMYQAGLIWEAVRDGGTASAALPDVGTPGTSLMTVRKIVKRERVKVELPVVDYPMLVTFANIADPRSVAAVDPANLGASFGAGVRLKRISVEVTNDAVTKVLDRRLKWLSPHPEPSLSRGHAGNDYSLPATLHHGDFRREI